MEYLALVVSAIAIISNIVAVRRNDVKLETMRQNFEHSKSQMEVIRRFDENRYERLANALREIKSLPVRKPGEKGRKPSHMEVDDIYRQVEHLLDDHYLFSVSDIPGYVPLERIDTLTAERQTEALEKQLRDLAQPFVNKGIGERK